MWLNEWDPKMAIKVAEEEGFEAGVQESIWIGVERCRKYGIEVDVKDIVRAMKKDRIPLRSISYITGLAKNDIKKI
jgi:hypothetical protein